MRFGGVQRTGPQLKGEPWRLNGEIATYEVCCWEVYIKSKLKFWGFLVCMNMLSCLVCRMVCCRIHSPPR